MPAHSRLATPCRKADLLLSQPMTSDLGFSRVDQGWTSLAFVQRRHSIDRPCENSARRSRPLSGFFHSYRLANIECNLVEAEVGSPASEPLTADPPLHPLTRFLATAPSPFASILFRTLSTLYTLGNQHISKHRRHSLRLRHIDGHGSGESCMNALFPTYPYTSYSAWSLPCRFTP